MAKVMTSLPGNDDDDVDETAAGDGGDGPSVVTEDEAAAAPQGVVLTAEQYADLQKKAEEGSSVTQVLEKLGEKLTPRQQEPLNVPVQQGPQETDEQYRKRIEDTMLTPGKAVDAVREVVLREAGPAFQQLLAETAMKEKKSLLKGDDERPHFKKYQAEIEAAVAQLPAGQRLVPGVWEKAYDAVVARHQGDIVSDLVAAQVKAELEKRGIVDEGAAPAGKAAPAAPRARVQTQGGAAPAARPAAAPTAIKVTPKEEAQYRREALNQGIDYEEYVRSLRREG